MARTYQDDTDLPFLEPDPPPLLARALSLLLLGLFVVAMVSLVLVSVPDTINAPFTLAPVRAADPVRTLHDGTVTEVGAVETHAVKTGDRLFVIASEVVGDRAAERDALDTTIRGGEPRLTNERRKYESQRAAHEKERARLEQRLRDLARQRALKNERIALAREVLERKQRSFEQGLVSQEALSQPQLDLNQAILELEQIGADISDTTGAIETLTADMESARMAFAETERAVHEDLDRARVRRDMFERDGHGHQNAITVDAPCDGTVVSLKVMNRGAVVHEGDLLAEVVCDSAKLQAELRLPQRGLAQVRPGQPVKLMYDAFPYQRYGLRYATIRWVSPASSPGQDGAFRAFADLEEPSGSSGGSDAARRPLAPGMAGRAAVITGRRTLLSYAIEPIRQIRENLAVRPSSGD
ncbi:MAG TPA: HlyD family efflux transporter periplasmic adaptor subunit [Vicinamibacterales bacterium]|nr:HlyD family efflux transporter periplasmic adaptor subunit [Vicinamibacterales bacterium]